MANNNHFSNTDPLWEAIRPQVEALSLTTSSCVFVVVREEGYPFLSPNLEMLGFDIPEAGYVADHNYLKERIHSKDRAVFDDFLDKLFDYLISVPDEQRNEYKYIFEFRMLNRNEQWVRMICQLQILGFNRLGRPVELGILDLSPEEREKRDTYRFYEIQYRIDPSAGDGMVEKSRELPAEVIVNRTFSTLTDTVRTPNDQFEYTEFRAGSSPNYTLEIDEDAVIKLPESLFFASTGSIWFRTEKQGFAPDADYSFPYTSSQSFSAGTIPPYCMRTAIHTVRYNETTVSYTALFVGRETGKTLEITGRCVSTDIVGIDSSIVLSEIE